MDLGIENLISSFASSISFIIHLEYFPHWTLSFSLNFPVNPRREQYQQRETERCLTMPNNHYNSLFPTPRALTFVQQQIRYHSSQGSPRWNDSNLDFQRTWPLSRRLQRCKFYFAVAVARTMHTRAYRSCTRRRGHSSLLPFPPLSPPLSLFLPDEGRFERTSGKVYREATNGWQLGDASVAICIGVGRVETSRPLSLSLFLYFFPGPVGYLVSPRDPAKTSREGRELTALPLPAA